MSSGRVTNMIHENEMLRKENSQSQIDDTVGEKCQSSNQSGIHQHQMSDCSICTNDKDWRNKININVDYVIGDKLEMSSQNTQHEADCKSC